MSTAEHALRVPALTHFLMLLALTEGVHRKGIFASNASYLQQRNI
jgi:hypothetical protein